MVLQTLTPCLMRDCSVETRNVWKERYRSAKKYGIRAAFTGVSGVGVLTLVKEAATGEIKRHGKRYMGCILMDVGLTFFSGGIPLVSNATKVIKYGKACHSVCAASWRAAHNVAELPLILIDFAVFGEYVPSCGESDYDFYSTTTDIFEEFL